MIYFIIDDNINPDLGAYSLEFLESIEDEYNGNVGKLFGAVNFRIAPILGRQYPNNPPLDVFVLSQVVVLVEDMKLMVNSNYRPSALPSDFNFTQNRNIIYSFSSLINAPNSMNKLTEPTLQPIQIDENYISEFTISFKDIFGRDLKPVDSSVLASIRLCIFLN